MSEQSGCYQDDELWELVESSVSDTDPAMREHVASCPACTSRVDEIGRLHEALADLANTATAPLPEQIGPYRIVRLIGQGGGGLVYEAEQTDPARRVALKVLRALGPTDHRRLRAFQREIRTLARLDHPSIAAIHSAGRTEDGQVYFAMQLVEGVWLDRHCAEHGLSMRERVQLVMAVAEAVHYAHLHGVMHRDLKPENILVDGKGRPRVLDFGLARPVSHHSSLTLSMDGAMVVGTLPYMSPEQVRADEDVDVRTDVYSLGVILYRLATGRAPYEVTHQLEQAARVIHETEPPHPSDIERRVPRELGDVIIKALAKERERRYVSMAAFTEDLGRFLAGDGVSARPSSTAYRLRVFARRNKGLVAATGTILAALALGLGMTSMMWTEARARGKESQNLTKALNDLVVESDPRLTGGRVGPRPELDRFVARLENEALFDRDSLEEAKLRGTIGVAYRHSMQYQKAVVHLRRALELRERFQDETHAEVVAARYEYGLALHRKGAVDEAASIHNKNRELHEAGRIPPSIELAGSLRQLATIENGFGPIPIPSEESYGQALAMVRGLPEGNERRREESWILTMMGLYVSELEDSIRFHREALAIRDQLDPNAWDASYSIANLSIRLENLALAWDAPAELAREALAFTERLVSLSSGLKTPGTGLPRLGHMQLVLADDPVTAASTFAEAIAWQRRQPGAVWHLSALLRHRATALRAGGRERDALAAEEESARELANLLDAHALDSEKRAQIHMDLSQYALLWATTPDEMVRHSRAAAAAWDEEAEPRDERWRTAMATLAGDLFVAGHLVEAVATYKRVLAASRAAGVEESRLLTIEVDLAEARFFAAEAETPSLADVEALLERARIPDDDRDRWLVPRALRLAGVVRERAGDVAGAQWRLRGSAGYHSSEHYLRSPSRWMLGRFLLARGELAEAEKELRAAYISLLPRTVRYWRKALLQCDAARLLARTGRTELAERLFGEAWPILSAAHEVDPRFLDEVRDVYDPETGEVLAR
ncbi:MAG: serine/threonine protein kinase [bacterium]|nr:serine/threonine protein kinase [bacterium]